MGAEYYLFAVFVFALVLILIILFVWGVKKNKAKDIVEIEEKEQKVMMLYFEVEDMINGLKEYVDASREKIEIDIKRIETNMQALSTLKEGLINMAQRPRHDMEQDFTVFQEQENGNDKRRGRAAVVFDLHDEGHDVGNIAKRMNLSKTEVA